MTTTYHRKESKEEVSWLASTSKVYGMVLGSLGESGIDEISSRSVWVDDGNNLIP